FTINLPVSASGRLGFRYFVENGGPFGANSDFLGIDTMAVVTNTPVFSQWSSTSGGSWNNAANWSGGIPNASGTKAKFLPSPNGLSAPATITLDGNVTVGQIEFKNSNSHTIAAGTGGGTLTIGDSGDTAGVSPIISASAGSHTITAPIAISGG